MRDLEIDMTNPAKPILWVRGEPIKRYHWGKVKAHELMTDAGLWGPKKQKALDFYRKYGTTAKACADFLNKGIIKMSLGAVKGHEPLCYVRSKFNSARTIDVCEMKDELDQAVADGIKNITPFIALYKQSPKQLKQTLGSANWKLICKNSFSRNKGIADILGAKKFDKPDDEYTSMLLKMPSGLFKRTFQYGLETAHYLNKKCGMSIKSLAGNKNEVFNNARLIADTRRMAEMYQQNFSFDWSWRKMQEKHNEFARIGVIEEAKRLKAENEKYSLTLREGKPKVWGFNGVVATFLDTYERILEEGVVMHHCVGSYARWCYEDRYAVVHLEGDGEKTTLGIDITPMASAHFNQHYGISNSPVKSESHKMLANLVIEELNKEAHTFKIVEITGITVNE
ncbi:hypothetical protein D3C87_324550 [compost metagenome]